MNSKRYVFSISLILVMFLCSCTLQSSAPWDIPGSFWNDSANSISFTVPESEDEPLTGTYSFDGEAVELTVKHDENRIAFFESSEDELDWDHALIHGSCKYDELLLTVVVEYSSIDGITEGSIIVFFKGDPLNTAE